MGIEVVFTKGEYRPVVTCDVCGKMIHDCREGIVCFPSKKPVFVHMGDCDDSQPLEVKYPWTHLYYFLPYLELNVAFTGKFARESRKNAVTLGV